MEMERVMWVQTFPYKVMDMSDNMSDDMSDDMSRRYVKDMSDDMLERIGVSVKGQR